MHLEKTDIKFRYTKGEGPGGQHKNVTMSCVIAKHIPTGIEVKVDGRNQHQNKRRAIKLLTEAVREYHENEKAKQKKAKRDFKIKNEERIRTYDYKKGIVIDHRTGKTASIKDILEKGQLWKLR